MDAYTPAQGAELVIAARRSAELHLISPRFDRKLVGSMLGPFDQPYGVRVSFLHYPTDSPRGSNMDLDASRTVREKIVRAAVAAGFEDPGHVSLTPFELEHVVTQVDIISEPVQLPASRTARLREVRPGRHGILVRYGFKWGMLMPDAAMRGNWSIRRFLEEACAAAGLHPNYWTQPRVKIYTFEVQSFREESPDGNVVETTIEVPEKRRRK